MLNFLYKWLPIIFGCHCQAKRSFFYKGKQFPICARCTGEAIGMLIAFVFWFVYPLSIQTCFVLMIPMIVDGFRQLLSSYESNNLLRLISGFLFGYALMTLFIISTIFIARQGYEYGRQLKIH